jgi:hypothetical protein
MGLIKVGCGLGEVAKKRGTGTLARNIEEEHRNCEVFVFLAEYRSDFRSGFLALMSINKL